MNIKDVTKYIKSQVGYHEKKSNKLLYTDKNNGSKNFTKYADMIKSTNLLNGNKQGVAWCAVFLIACFWDMIKDEKKTHKVLSIPNNSAAAGAYYFYKYMRKVNEPREGDLIFFGTGKPTHVGYVYKVTSVKIYTIEGNSSDSVKKHTYLKNSKKIYGYTRPYYEEA